MKLKELHSMMQVMHVMMTYPPPPPPPLPLCTHLRLPYLYGSVKPDIWLIAMSAAHPSV